MVLTKGVHVGTLFHLDACTIECNSSSISVVERSIGSTPSQSKPPIYFMVMLSRVPKQALLQKASYLQRRQCYGTKYWAI
jgi:hypothetical protein